MIKIDEAKLTKPQNAVIYLMAKGWELHVWMGRDGNITRAELKNKQGGKTSVHNGTFKALLRKGLITYGHDIYQVDVCFPISKFIEQEDNKE